MPPKDIFDRLISSTIGFDSIANFVDTLDFSNYPPYNIEKVLDHDMYVVTLAVAGFNKSELEVSLSNNLLTIKGERKARPETKTQMLYQGLGFRSFKRDWKLGENVEVDNVSLVDGLLVVILREIESTAKTKKFDIN
jgi:molecular chaperone IbpA